MISFGISSLAALLVIVSLGGLFYPSNLRLRQIEIFVLDYPEKESFEDDDVISGGILFEWPSSYAMVGRERFDAGVNRADGEVLEWRDKTSPTYECADDFVAAGDAYSCGRPLFGEGSFDMLQDFVVDLSDRESPVDSCISIFRFDTTGRLRFHRCGKYTKESFRPPYIKGEP